MSVQNAKGRKLTVDFRVCDLRLRRPLPIPHSGSSKRLFPALNFSSSCPQQSYTLSILPDIDCSPLRGLVTKVKPSEGCEPDRMFNTKIFPGLYLNVFRPAGVSADTLGFLSLSGFTEVVFLPEMLRYPTPPPSFLALFSSVTRSFMFPSTSG